MQNLQLAFAEEVTQMHFIEFAMQADGGFAKRNGEKDDTVRKQSDADAVSLDLMEEYGAGEGKTSRMTEEWLMPQIIEEATANHMDEAVHMSKLMKSLSLKLRSEMNELPHD